MFDPVKREMITTIDAVLDKLMLPLCENSQLALDQARVYKATEELGEVSDAFQGYRGLNPRKGVTGTREHFLSELADLALTPIYALMHFTKDVDQVERYLLAAMWKHYERALETE